MGVSLYNTPDKYLADMIASVQSSGSQVTDFSIGSVVRTIFSAHSAVLSEQSLIADGLRLGMHLETAVGDDLDTKGADYLVPRKGAVVAAGSVQITRPSTGVAVTLQAGFGQLQTQAAVGQQPIGFLTTQDAVFGSSDLTKTVSAVAVLGGAAGNIADQTVLFPLNPVSGFPTASSFKASGAFTNGFDPEADDAYRARIKLTVQGRVNGTSTALQAAALSVPGVTSAGVLRAGDARADTTIVGAGNCEVYYAGSSGLLSAVQSAVALAQTLNQQVTCFTATSLRLICNLTVWAKNGVDTGQLTTSIVTAVQTLVAATGVGVKVYLSDVIQAINGVPNVIAAQLPLTDFRKSTDPGGTAADVATPANQYPSLASSDMTVAFTLL